MNSRLVDTESRWDIIQKDQECKQQIVNDAHADDADIRPIYDEEPMAEVQTTAEINVFATGQQHTEQPEFNNEGEVEQNAEQCHDKCPFPAKLTDNHITEHSYQSLESENVWKPVLQPHRNQSVVRQPTAFKSERPRSSRPRFAYQVDVNNDLSKPVTTHYLPKEKESAVAKPHHMIAPGSSRYRSNDMVHNHYLEEAKQKTQESRRNSEPSVMPSAKSQSTAKCSKPKPRSNTQTSRNWPVSKNSFVTTKTVPIAEHSRNSRNFSDSKHFVCSTCQKCVFNANHDHCVTKFLNKVNSRAKVPSNKTTNRNKPVEQTSFAKKQKRQIPKGHRFSIKKTSVVHEKIMTPRSCLRWKPTGRIFKTVGLRWVPTGKIFVSSTNKVDTEPPNGSNEDITNPYECKQTLDVSAGTLNLSAGTYFNPKKEALRVCSELGIHDHSNEPSSSKLVPKVVPPADKTATSRQELELLFHHHITMLRSYALSWKPCQGDSLNLPDHRLSRLYLGTLRFGNDQIARIIGLLKTKDEAPAAIIKYIKNIQVCLKATVQNVRTNNGTEFVNQTLREWYENVGISHQTFVARTPQQNGVVRKAKSTLVKLQEQC
ncbi:reverse transcriptase domain-containing protein [Tanacetum coccineum]|uniref:Reverse transcriptase domain-containing protein n=1 Tax=Tanacetum coccineum TaxID=301880 RepID=A0ABQ4Y360_9ASTR